MAKITRNATVHSATDGGASTNPISFSKNIPADCTFVVLLTVVNRSGTGQNISGVTIGGAVASNITSFPSSGTSIPRISGWYLENPATGSQTFEITYGGTSANRAFIVLYFKDQHASAPLNAATPTTGSGNSTAPAVGPISNGTDGTTYSVVAWNDDGITIDGSPIRSISSASSGANSRELVVYETTTAGSVSLAQTLSATSQWRAFQFVLDGIASASGVAHLAPSTRLTSLVNGGLVR